MLQVRNIFILIAFLIFQTVSAQDAKQADDNKEKPVEPKIKLIPTIELTSRIPDATNKIKKIKQSLISKDDLYLQKAILDTFFITLKEFEKKHKSFDKRLTDQARLQDELYQWDNKKEELGLIQKKINSINNDLLNKKEKLQEIKTVWEKSLEAAKKDNLPRNAKKLVTSFLSEIENIEILVNQKSNFVYSLLEKITNTTISINDNIQVVEKKLNNLTELLLFTKEPSLLKIILSDNDSTTLKRTYTVKELYTPIKHYVSDNSIYIIIHFIFLLLLIILLFVVKRRIKPEKYKSINPRLLHTVFEVLSRPLSSAFLIYLLSSNMLYADAPPILRTLTYFLLLIPVMIILPVITVKQLNFYIYGLGAVYLLTLFLRLHLVNPVFQYFIILVTTVFAILGIGKFLKKSIIIRIFPDNTSRNLISLLFYAFVVLLVIAFFAIIVGYYSLGVFLFDNTIWSIYRFFLFYAAYVLLEGFTELIIYSEYVSKINSIRKNKDDVLKWLATAIRLILTYYLFKEIFNLFKVWDKITESISNIWTFEITAGNINFSIGNVFTLIITLYLSNLLAKTVSSVLENDILKKFRFKRGVPRTISTLAKYTILTIGFLTAVAAAGMDIKNFTIILGALGVGIGFGLQDIINNFISGLILLFERPIQVGDTVQVDQLWGTVKNIGIRSSVIRAFDGSEVIVPNSMLISREVTNWTLSDQKRRLEIEVGVEYGTDLKKVLKILIDSANKNKKIMQDPAPSAWFIGFGDSSINFKLVFWHPEFDGSLAVKSEVAINIFDAFEKEGITIPFPQQDVYIKENVTTGLGTKDDQKEKENTEPDTDTGKEPIKESNKKVKKTNTGKKGEK